MTSKKDKILQLYRDNPDWTKMRIAEELGLTPRYVCTVCNEYDTHIKIAGVLKFLLRNAGLEITRSNLQEIGEDLNFLAQSCEKVGVDLE